MPSGRSAPPTSGRTGSAETSRDEISGVDGAAIGTVEWGPVRYDRSRSAALGVAAVIAAAVVTALAALGLALATGLTSGGSPIALGVLLVAATVISLLPVVAVARSEWVPESGSLREAIDFSSLRPRWVLGGCIATVGLFVIVPRGVVGGLWPLASVLFVLPHLVRSGGDDGARRSERADHRDEGAAGLLLALLTAPLSLLFLALAARL
ncbi:hypothetical protein [Halorubrum sp. BV1]|uniref:hypothetical protein n=1 Tax=Halorubrum sp. BV1 TaxID=1498500 RepID=UPI000678D7C9|nr:hypothetical protein [Halorubrum sp. BV1]